MSCRSRLLLAAAGIVTATTVLGCSGGTPSPHDSGSQSPGGTPTDSHSPAESQGFPTAPAAPWSKVWSQEFSGPAGQGVSTATWKYETGPGARFGTDEAEFLTNSTANVHLDGHGHLDIVPLRHGSGWTSGRLQTVSDQFGAPPGGEMIVTASIKQPAPANPIGYWPGFWMLGPGQWPEHGEVDILEDVDAYNQVAGTLHCGNLSQRNPDGTFGPCHEHSGIGSGFRPCPGCQSGYHTYSVLIDRHSTDQQVTWYLDGHAYFTVRESQVGTSAWRRAVDHGFSIILDVAMGGSYPDSRCQCPSPTAQTTPGAAMSIGYVSVYTRTG